ncbi:MAG: hypothetical protein ACTTJS_03760 [Wolinella sp.]
MAPDTEQTVVSVSEKYGYGSPRIRPLLVRELFPIKIIPSASVLEFSSTEEFIERVSEDFKRLQSTIDAELRERNMLHGGASLVVYLNDVVHRSKSYPPRNVVEDGEFGDIASYFKNLTFAHCGHKPKVLKMILDLFGIKSRVIEYSDLLGWEHGFVEVILGETCWIFCPTFNMVLDTNINELVENPWRARTFLPLYSDEFYAQEIGECQYDSFYRGICDELGHITYRYNREWFSAIGLYSLVPPIYRFVCDGEVLYDVADDKRFMFTE